MCKDRIHSYGSTFLLDLRGMYSFGNNYACAYITLHAFRSFPTTVWNNWYRNVQLHSTRPTLRRALSLSPSLAKSLALDCTRKRSKKKKKNRTRRSLNYETINRQRVRCTALLPSQKRERSLLVAPTTKRNEIRRVDYPRGCYPRRLHHFEKRIRLLTSFPADGVYTFRFF